MNVQEQIEKGEVLQFKKREGVIDDIGKGDVLASVILEDNVLLNNVQFFEISQEYHDKLEIKIRDEKVY